MKLTYIGHSCFKVEEQGYTVIFDPYEDGHVPGYANIREEADLVLCSHEHGDHNARGVITGKEGGTNPFVITEIETYHDEAQGTLRGPNTIRVLDNGVFRLAHFGDLGCELTAEQQAQLQNLDVALVPVGGFFTIDAQTAKKVVDSIRPRVVIPMHYRGNGFGYEVLGTVEAYLELCDDATRMLAESIEITGSLLPGTVTLVAQNLAS